jgi:hypothetical protein
MPDNLCLHTFMASGTQNYQILWGIILAIMVEMGYLQNSYYAESAVSAY